jgi:hypothetical protein
MWTGPSRDGPPKPVRSLQPLTTVSSSCISAFQLCVMAQPASACMLLTSGLILRVYGDVRRAWQECSSTGADLHDRSRAERTMHIDGRCSRHAVDRPRYPGAWPWSPCCSSPKGSVYVVTKVDRATRCLVSYAVVWERTWEALQETVERAERAHRRRRGLLGDAVDEAGRNVGTNRKGGAYTEQFTLPYQGGHGYGRASYCHQP